MTITIKDPAVERELLALAASKGGDMEAALVALLAIEKRRAALQKALKDLKEIVPPGVVIEGDTRASLYPEEA